MVIHFTVLHLWSVIYYISKGLVFISFMVGIDIWLTFMTFMVSVTFVIVITLIILWVMQILMEHKMQMWVCLKI